MWIQISSGRGPIECSKGVYMFYTLLISEIKKAGFEAEMLDCEKDYEPNTYKSVVISTNINEDNKIVNDLEGSILWVWKSKFRPEHKRKNWFIDVEKFYENDEIIFSESEIKIETMKSSGPGGQNVNKVESAVRITHIPTNITVIARGERSQYLNKKFAIAQLKKIIENIDKSNKKSLEQTMWKQHTSLERGNPVRTYKGDNFELNK